MTDDEFNAYADSLPELPREEPSLGESVGRAAMQGATLGGAKTIFSPLGEAIANRGVAAANSYDSGGGIAGAMSEMLRLRKLYDDYQAAKPRVAAQYNAAAQAHPVASLATEMVTGAPASLALGAGKPWAGALKYGAVAGLLGGSHNLSQGNVLGAAGDVAENTAMAGMGTYLGGPILGAMGDTLAHPFMAAQKAKIATGQAMQVPQKAYERVAEPIGSTGLAKATSAAMDVRGSNPSQLVKELRVARSAPEFGGANYSGAVERAGLRLGNITDKPVGSLNEKELDKLSNAMSEAFNGRGLSTTPEFVRKNVGELIDLAGLKGENVSAIDFLRIANKRDPAHGSAALDGIRRFWVGKLVPEAELSPEMRDAFSSNQAAREAFANQSLDRLGRPIGPAAAVDTGQYQIQALRGILGKQQGVPVQTTPGFTKEQLSSVPYSESSQMLSNYRDAYKHVASPEEGLKTAMADASREAEIKSLPGGRYGPTRADIYKQEGIVPSQVSQLANQIRTRGQAQMASGPLNAQAADAGNRLQNIATGRKYIDDVALGKSLGHVPGVPAIARTMRYAGPKYGDALGGFGQKLAESGRSKLGSMLAEAAKDPGLLTRLASRQDKVGAMANHVLQGGKDGMAARAFVLSMQPEFRDLIGGGEKAQ